MASAPRAWDVAHKAIVTGLFATTILAGSFVFLNVGNIFQRAYTRRQEQQK